MTNWFTENFHSSAVHYNPWIEFAVLQLLHGLLVAVVCARQRWMFFYHLLLPRDLFALLYVVVQWSCRWVLGFLCFDLLNSNDKVINSKLMTRNVCAQEFIVSSHVSSLWRTVTNWFMIIFFLDAVHYNSWNEFMVLRQVLYGELLFVFGECWLLDCPVLILCNLFASLFVVWWSCRWY